jgi:hypothetical protein
VTESLVELERQGKLRVPVLTYSRVVGYLTPVQNWNAGKRQEYRERKKFCVKPDFGKQNE